MEWIDEHTTIVCQLFAQQVVKGNRPNTHLNSVGYDEVIQLFRQITGIELSKRQLRNKWDKMKPDFVAWQKLMRQQTGTGWDHSRGVIVMDDEWWRKAKKDIPGCGKFRKKPLQNVDDLNIMFSDIINDASDHWNPMSENPIIPEHMTEEVQEDNLVVDDEEVQETPMEEMNDEAQECHEVSPSIGIGKRRSRAVLDKGKKSKIGTALVIQEQITKIAESASSFTSKKSNEVTVQQIMDLVLDCGADYGSDEHFIAIELFVKKDQRDMFMTLPNKEFRFNWLRRKYNAKYGA
nr:L10-interacting MYB domain-containing protein isoform X2 [Oryza sativa Japonica Group]